jgi:hypothetical protein
MSAAGLSVVAGLVWLVFAAPPVGILILVGLVALYRVG